MSLIIGFVQKRVISIMQRQQWYDRMILVQVTMFQCDASPCLKYKLRNYCKMLPNTD